ncbi:MAG: hypothetical protein WAN20_20855 [Pseudonocardiaceae bacterium]|jgi:hypothetical protein|nr:hypothetical protein [Pseudonocardiaceae bacterium]
MPRYGPVWLEIVREQYTSLPADAREQIDTRVEQYLRIPGSNPAPPTTSALTSGPPPTVTAPG